MMFSLSKHNNRRETNEKNTLHVYRIMESYKVLKEICKISLKCTEKHEDLMCFKCRVLII